MCVALLLLGLLIDPVEHLRQFLCAGHDARCNLQLRGDDFAGLAHLTIVGGVAGVDGCVSAHESGFFLGTPNWGGRIGSTAI